jgi:alpha-glucosidase
MMKSVLSISCLLILALSSPFSLFAEQTDPNGTVDLNIVITVPPKSVVQTYKLDPFYKKYLDAGGIAVTSSEKVVDEALHEVRYLIHQALQNRADILGAMANNRTRIAIIGAKEEVSEVPEYYKSDPEEAERQNRRVRGYGGMRLTSCGEENLLNYEGDRYQGENIFLHEFAHCIHSTLRRLDPDFQKKLDQLYRDALGKGLWDRTYAATNASEYWAEGVQDYWDCNRQSRNSQETDGVHNHVNTKEELKEYDPDLYAFIDQTLGPMEWRYTRYIDRTGNNEIKKDTK